MTDQEILKAAIAKVISPNGSLPSLTEDEDIYIQIGSYHIWSGDWWDRRFEIIFSHDFAKAFWGEKEFCGNCHSDYIGTSSYGRMCQSCDNYSPITNWEYHLQEMVLEENPLRYLEQFLSDPKEKEEER